MPEETLEVKLARLIGERLIRPMVEYQLMLSEAMEDARREVMGDATVFDLDFDRFLEGIIEEARKISPNVDPEEMRALAHAMMSALGRPKSIGGSVAATPSRGPVVEGHTPSDLPIAQYDPNALQRAELESRARHIFEACLVQNSALALDDDDIQEAVTAAHKLTRKALGFDPVAFCRQLKPELYGEQ